MIDQTFGNVWIIEKEIGRAPHPASLADLVEVLKQEGALVLEARQSARGWRAHVMLPRFANDGDPYLVLPLDGTTPK